KYDLTSIRACLSGAAPLPLAVAEKFESITGAKVVEGYGLTETSPITHANPIYGKRKEGSIGLPIPDTDCKIVDLDDWTKEVDPGHEGELAVAGPQVMKGYFNRPEETAGTIKQAEDGTRSPGTRTRACPDTRAPSSSSSATPFPRPSSARCSAACWRRRRRRKPAREIGRAYRRRSRSSRTQAPIDTRTPATTIAASAAIIRFSRSYASTASVLATLRASPSLRP